MTVMVLAVILGVWLKAYMVWPYSLSSGLCAVALEDQLLRVEDPNFPTCVHVHIHTHILSFEN